MNRLGLRPHASARGLYCFRFAAFDRHRDARLCRTAGGGSARRGSARGHPAGRRSTRRSRHAGHRRHRPVPRAEAAGYAARDHRDSGRDARAAQPAQPRRGRQPGAERDPAPAGRLIRPVDRRLDPRHRPVRFQPGLRARRRHLYRRRLLFLADRREFRPARSRAGRDPARPAGHAPGPQLGRRRDPHDHPPARRRWRRLRRSDLRQPQPDRRPRRRDLHHRRRPLRPHLGHGPAADRLSSTGSIMAAPIRAAALPSAARLRATAWSIIMAASATPPCAAQIRYNPDPGIDIMLAGDYTHDDRTNAAEVLVAAQPPGNTLNIGTGLRPASSSAAATATTRSSIAAGGRLGRSGRAGHPACRDVRRRSDARSTAGACRSTRISALPSGSQLQSITAYRAWNNRFNADDDLSPSNIGFGQNALDYWFWSQELRLNADVSPTLSISPWAAIITISGPNISRFRTFATP